MELYTVVMTFVKETKGAVRYEEVGDENKIGTLYIRKDGLGGKPIPKRLSIKMTALE